MPHNPEGAATKPKQPEFESVGGGVIVFSFVNRFSKPSPFKGAPMPTIIGEIVSRIQHGGPPHSDGRKPSLPTAPNPDARCSL